MKIDNCSRVTHPFRRMSHHRPPQREQPTPQIGAIRDRQLGRRTRRQRTHIRRKIGNRKIDFMSDG
jgi:hypothetical protein